MFISIQFNGYIMKIYLLIILFSSIPIINSAQESGDRHPLDGCWVKYKYETSGEVRLEFFDGKVIWKWLNNSNPEESARDEKLTEKEKSDAINYRSQIIGDQIYVVNWYHQPSGSYVTIILNYKERQMCGSAILGAKEENTTTIFDKGIIEDYNFNGK